MPDGTVNFTEGAITLGTAQLSKGMASPELSSLTTGRHTLVAQYSGSSTFERSTSRGYIQTMLLKKSGQLPVGPLSKHKRERFGLRHPRRCPLRLCCDAWPGLRSPGFISLRYSSFAIGRICALEQAAKRPANHPGWSR
jgi:hypothetical protein